MLELHNQQFDTSFVTQLIHHPSTELWYKTQTGKTALDIALRYHTSQHEAAALAILEKMVFSYKKQIGIQQSFFMD